MSLMGEETGRQAMKEVVSITTLPDQLGFIIANKDGEKRAFQACSQSECQLWVEALQSVISTLLDDGTSSPPSLNSNSSSVIAGFRSFSSASSSFSPKTPHMVLEMETIGILKPGNKEIILARNPNTGIKCLLDDIAIDDVLIVRFNNGAMATASLQALKANVGKGTVELGVCTRGEERTGSMRCILSPVRTAILPTLSHSDNITALVIFISAIYYSNLSFSAFCILMVVAAKVFYGSWRLLSPFEVTVVDFTFGLEKPKFVEKKEEVVVIPHKFMEGCQGDPVEAKRRWLITKKWREEMKMDEILQQPHPNFKLIKEIYPHYFCGKARNGDVLYVERAKEADLPLLRANDVSTEDLIWHQCYITEYLNHHLLPDKDKNKLIFVVDLNGISLSVSET